MGFYLIQTLNALAFSVLLMLCGLGLSLVLSLMNFVNLTHGSSYLFGSYAAVVWLGSGAPWWLAVPAAFLAAALAGLLLDRFPFARFYGRNHLAQVLLTYGLSVMFADLMRLGFGAEIRSPVLPDLLRGVVFVLGMPFPIYRIVLILAGGVLALVLWYLFDRTIWGAVVRASVADRRMVETLGLDTRRVFALVMAIAAGLGGLSGALGVGMLSAYPGLDEEILLHALFVVVLGGLGTFRGTVAGALVLGFAMTFARVWLSEFAGFLTLLAIALLLVLRPDGLVAPKLRQV
ncbi:MAG TPA: branched-chain amino acid ABC transporter permease [Geminicoccus sp.]|uniref:branched-chain amino acid ABC transporter permease n=1 Tax=Geminicoccus sp. TaxID=2024832 RepID=UPI002D015283|nr:branched-chain amino acid ABC transporter permease [Geminicoccus sp.]HWL71526.1 branched-chain amino acid ABC transporter permease [Geminicoccus sp.]